MTRLNGDDFTLIELHKMAAERGDGVIPEILDVLRRRGDALAAVADLMQVADPRSEPATVSHPDNVIGFPIARRGAGRR